MPRLSLGRIRLLVVWGLTAAHAVGGFSVTIWTTARADYPIQLRDMTSETGIGFRHNDGSGGRYYLVESMSAGLALFDYDVDGDIDQWQRLPVDRRVRLVEGHTKARIRRAGIVGSTP